ncbi:hypothetical protein TPA0906_29590 [Streptomyces olivaceus]|nr:hypothetical protein TPA0906_29590 [Streptomyces olivaceus]
MQNSGSGTAVEWRGQKCEGPLADRRTGRPVRAADSSRTGKTDRYEREKEEDAIRIARSRTSSPGTAGPGTEGGPTVTHPRSLSCPSLDEGRCGYRRSAVQ